MNPNVFVLDYSAALSAQGLADDHLADAASWAVELLVAAGDQTHPLCRHILTRWAGSHVCWAWLWKYAFYALHECQWRFGTTERHVEELFSTLRAPQESLQPGRFVQLVPPKYKQPGHAVEAYRAWYNAEHPGAAWTRRAVPEWYVAAVQLPLTLSSQS